MKHFSPRSEDVTGAASLGVLVQRLQQWNNGGTVSAAAVEMNVERLKTEEQKSSGTSSESQRWWSDVGRFCRKEDKERETENTGRAVFALLIGFWVQKNVFVLLREKRGLQLPGSSAVRKIQTLHEVQWFNSCRYSNNLTFRFYI